MDNRWIGIIIILLIGLGAMYLIVDSSNTIGNAIAVIGDASVTLPPDFKAGDTNVKDASMYNPHNNNTIFINFLGKGNNSLKYYKGNLSSLKNNGEITIFNFTSNKIVHTIKYENPNSKYENHNETLVFFEKYDRTFSMKLVKYDNFKNQDKDISFIVDNIKLDFKQKKSGDDYKEFTI